MIEACLLSGGVTLLAAVEEKSTVISKVNNHKRVKGNGK